MRYVVSTNRPAGDRRDAPVGASAANDTTASLQANMKMTTWSGRSIDITGAGYVGDRANLTDGTLVDSVNSTRTTFTDRDTGTDGDTIEGAAVTRLMASGGSMAAPGCQILIRKSDATVVPNVSVALPFSGVEGRAVGKLEG